MRIKWTVGQLASAAMIAALTSLVPVHVASAATTSAAGGRAVTSAVCSTDNSACVAQAVAGATDSQGNVDWSAANPQIAACFSGQFFGGAVCSIGSSIASAFSWL